MVKPFSPMELVARFSAAQRRKEATRQAVPEDSYVVEDLIINYP